jgi:hypothetical protein
MARVLGLALGQVLVLGPVPARVLGPVRDLETVRDRALVLGPAQGQDQAQALHPDPNFPTEPDRPRQPAA